jgi:hypothetical protein
MRKKTHAHAYTQRGERERERERETRERKDDVRQIHKHRQPEGLRICSRE